MVFNCFNKSTKHLPLESNSLISVNLCAGLGASGTPVAVYMNAYSVDWLNTMIDANNMVSDKTYYRKTGVLLIHQKCQRPANDTML